MKLNKIFRYFFCILPVILLVPFSAYADVIEVEYKSFYSHVRKLNSEDTKGLRFAFGFKHIETGRLCRLNSAKISTQKQQIPLNVTPENRFSIQSERALRLADAVVVIDVVEPSNKCDMSVQLETKPNYLKQRYQKEDLIEIYSQYQAFFNEMGSFLSFMMPSVTGLRIQFEDESLTTSLNSGMQIKAGMLTLSEEVINNIDTLGLPEKPLRITAIASK